MDPVHCTPERPRTTSVRFECWRKLGSDALASTATSRPVAVRRSRKPSCASTEAAGTRDDVFVWDHETDSRRWYAESFEQYLAWWLVIRITRAALVCHDSPHEGRGAHRWMPLRSSPLQRPR
jgi:hypothetical protein